MIGKIGGVKLNDSQVRQLLATKKTDVITGFTSKTGKKFDAPLKLNTEGQIVFDFPDRPQPVETLSLIHIQKPTKEQLIEKLVSFKGLPQELELPSAPKQFIQYLEEDNRPQVALDVNFENGMGISVGRLREDTVYDWKFVGLSHNTVRGAAGGAVLCAELLKAQGYITKK